ncbi:glycosyltransferase [Myxococcota bacterium]|nr:glycosyltransferase [Myxococcota bacterium]
MRARLEALARDLGARVVFAGAVTDVPSFLRALDVFVLSSDDEASPNALLEAMATGLASSSLDSKKTSSARRNEGTSVTAPA